MVPVMEMAATVAAPERKPEATRTAATPRGSHLILGLQRAAGNRAVGRMLARCGAGGCTCGGACGGGHAEDDLLLEEGQRALQRAVAQR
jgi:hypothetical protein